MGNDMKPQNGEKEPADRLHLTVGILVLAAGAYFSLFAIQVLLR